MELHWGESSSLKQGLHTARRGWERLSCVSFFVLLSVVYPSLLLLITVKNTHTLSVSPSLLYSKLCCCFKPPLFPIGVPVPLFHSNVCHYIKPLFPLSMGKVSHRVTLLAATTNKASPQGIYYRQDFPPFPSPTPTSRALETANDSSAMKE